jgi:hypothetical protein
MMGSILSAEQRLALAMLATAGLDGATQSLLSGRGFGASLVAGLVNRGLVTIMYERVRAGGTMVEVTKVRITDAGRGRLKAEPDVLSPSLDHEPRAAMRYFG